MSKWISLKDKLPGIPTTELIDALYELSVECDEDIKSKLVFEAACHLQDLTDRIEHMAKEIESLDRELEGRT